MKRIVLIAAALLLFLPSTTANAVEVPPAASASLQDVIDALPAMGGEVRLVAGDYEIDEGLTVDTDNVRLIGAGSATRIICDCIGEHVLEVTGDGFELSHMALGHLDPVTRDAKYAVYVNAAARASLHDFSVFAATGAGVILKDSDDSRVSRAHVSGTLADGIHVTGGSVRVSIADSTVISPGDDAIAAIGYQSSGQLAEITISGNSVSGGDANGIHIEGADGATVTGNTVSGVDGNGIHVSQSSAWATYGSTRVTVSANVVSDAAEYGISTWSYNDEYPVAYVTIDANTVTGTGKDLIKVGVPGDAGATHHITISGNVVDGNASNSGIGAATVDHLLVANNQIDNVYLSGVNVASTATGAVVITGNIVTDAEQGPTTAYSYIILGGDVTLTSNVGLGAAVGKDFYLCGLTSPIVDNNRGDYSCWP